MPIPFPTGGDIVSLLARQSDPAAQAKLASGEIWGRTLSQLGQLPSQIMEQRARDQQLQLQRQTQALQAFKLQQEVQQQQQAIAGQQRANQAITDFYKEQNGAQIFDPSKLDAKLAEANVPLDQREKAMASLDAMNKAMLGFSDHRQAAQNTILKHVQEEGATPENLSVAFDLGTRNGAFTPQDIEDYKARTQQGMTPQQWVDLRIGPKPAKDIEEEAKAKIAAGQAAGMSPEGLLPEQQATLEISRQAAERQAAAQAFSQQARTKELAQGDTRIALERQRLAQGEGAAGVPGATGALTPEGVEYAATQYRITGKMPTMGMGNSQGRADIINAAARQTKELGQSPVASIQRQAVFKADSGASSRS